MKKFRKKPIEVEAIQFTGNNFDELAAFTEGRAVPSKSYKELLVIPTVEGNLYGRKADWIIKGVAGEFYPCKPDIFDQTYEEVTT